MEVHDWLRHWIDFSFLALCSELDAKAEEQCADSIEEIDWLCLCSGFANEENALFKVAHLAHSHSPLFWRRKW